MDTKIISNLEIAQILRKYANSLESHHDNPYKIRAYRRAASAIEKRKKSLKNLLENDFDLTKIRGIGKSIAFQIRQIIEGNDILELFNKEQLKKPLIKNFKVINFQKSKKASKQKFFRIQHVIGLAEYILEVIKSFPETKNASIVGDLRRKVEIINNLNFIVGSNYPKNIILQFCSLPYVKNVIELKRNSITVNLFQGIELNLKIVPNSKFSYEIFMATGSEAHLKKLNKINRLNRVNKINKIKKISTKSHNKKFTITNLKSEKKIYQSLGLSFIPPELREDRGEIELAKNIKNFNLIELKDIRGDLHSHTNETDGYEDLETMVRKAQSLGYEYIAITDHTQNLKITNGLDKKRLFNQIKLIDKLNEKLNNITILKGSEVDILENGQLDLPISILKELDLTVCSIHSYFRISEPKQTDRILRAMDNPYFNILGHATGRLIKRREPYEINLPKILKAAQERNCILELNAQPYRLDICDVYCQLAKEYGVKIAISTDAHSLREFDNMKYGIFQARRGFLTPFDVINTRNLIEFKKIIKRI